jgi:hypothetical protein
MASAKCPASGRQIGHVRQSHLGMERVTKKKWSVRFGFNRLGEYITVDGPVRACRTEAEADRSFVAFAMSHVASSSRVDAAKRWIKFLREGGEPFSDGVPGSASTAPKIDPTRFQNMTKPQLRELASKTPGITLNKKTPQGKFISKTNSEVKAEILAVLPGRSTQALLGPLTNKKHVPSFAPRAIAMKRSMAQALPSRMASRKRPAAALGKVARKRPAAVHR